MENTEEFVPEIQGKEHSIPMDAMKVAMVTIASMKHDSSDIYLLAEALTSYAESHKLQPFLIEYLKIWKDSGIPAPLNELQSIAGWMRYLGDHDKKGTLDAMRKRSILLMKQAGELYKAGPEAEDAFGIYENRSREDVNAITRNT